MGRSRLIAALCSTLFLFGCTTFRENHYFRSEPKSPDATPNFFRLQVQGHAGFSKARYVAGFYDERAVDLFFNELKTESGKEGDIAPLFQAEQKEPGTSDTIKPLTPTPAHGSFVMVLSTNSKAVTDVIGEFAESQLVADAMTNLANRDEIKAAGRLDARIKGDALRTAATAAEIDKLIATVPSADQPDRDQTVRAYLRLLDALTTAVGERQDFTTIESAAKWVERQRATRRGD